MENRKVFVSVDKDGVKLLLQIMESLLDKVTEESSLSDNINEQYSILLPPSYMSCFDDEELPDGFYEWISKQDVLNEKFLVNLRKITSNAESTVDSDNEFLCNCLHEIADELPAPGSCMLEVYLHAGKDYFIERNLHLLSSLKRFEISHQAYFGVLSPQELSTKNLLSNWLHFIDFNYISVEDLLCHFKSSPIWSGLIEIKIQNSYANIPLQHYFLYPVERSSQPLFNMSTLQNKNKKITFDSRIEIVAMVTSEMIPLHLINPNRFTMHSFPPVTDDSFNFFDLQPNSSDENVFFLGFLRFDLCDDSHKFTTSDWLSYVNDPFTHHLSTSYCQQTLSNHCTLLIEFDKATQGTFVYFFKMPDDINVAGFVKLLQTELGKVDNDMLNASGSEKTFYKNGADSIPTWQWCEKNAWHEEENLSKVVKSISRCKSDEFYMQGVMVPGVENIKDGVQHDFFASVLTIFDKNGTPVISNLNPIPVIDDRLLKNIKGEENLTNMDYSDAKKQIGHGLDYCIDSLGSIRLSERLTKVQKQLVPEDTISFTSGKFSAKEESVMTSIKKNVPKTKVNANKKIIKKKESRADKTKRRLRTIVEGTVTKYGHLPNTHMHYKECCDSLFDVCIALVKTLKSSKDLNDNMKQFAKTNVNHVLTSVLAKTKQDGS